MVGAFQSNNAEVRHLGNTLTSMVVCVIYGTTGIKLIVDLLTVSVEMAAFSGLVF